MTLNRLMKVTITKGNISATFSNIPLGPGNRKKLKVTEKYGIPCFELLTALLFIQVPMKILMGYTETGSRANGDDVGL